MDTLVRNLKEKQLEALYNNIPTIVVLTSIVSTALACALLFEFPKVPIFIWLAYMYLICIIRWFTWIKFKKEGFQQKEGEFWVILFMVFSLSASIGTGYLIYTYFDLNNLVYTIFVFMTYAGYLSAGILTNSVYMPAFFAYSLPPTILVLIRLFVSGDPAFFTISIVIVFYYFALMGFARKANLAFKANISWNLEKDSLVEELRKQKEAAEQAIQSKSQFFASASHDLRQPLHALGLFHDALRHRLQDQENLEIMDKISDSTQSLNDLLHDMLDISKLDASVIENKPEDLNLSQALGFLSTEFLVHAKKKNLSFIVDVDPIINLWVDPKLFERVVRNLIDNAIKYTEYGSVTVSCDEYDDKSVLLKIEDTGIGIPKEELENVFSEFNQLGNPGRDRQKGLGLGLSIVRRLCELMNIEFRLESELGKGTVFSLVLEKGLSAKFTDKKTLSENLDTYASILIIEDDLSVMDGMSILLKTHGFAISKAHNTQEALELTDSLKPDLILADYRLPGKLDGLKLIDLIRKNHKTIIPAILITGETSPDKLKDAASADVLVMHKPVKSIDLENAINTMLAK